MGYGEFTRGRAAGGAAETGPGLRALRRGETGLRVARPGGGNGVTGAQLRTSRHASHHGRGAGQGGRDEDRTRNRTEETGRPCEA
jgi:hypothetical protein